jgi:glucosamine--fructose-6-phosphate aminotransferase (isomerizing)
MCGIVGYDGKRYAVPVILDGLARLEYRGCHSAGVASLNGRGIEIVRAAGKLGGIEEQLFARPLSG